MTWSPTATRPSPEDIVLTGLERQRIEGLLNHLDDRSAGIMRARYGLEDGREHSLTEVASRFSLSRERIRQLEIQALGRLRELARRGGACRRPDLSSGRQRLVNSSGRRTAGVR